VSLTGEVLAEAAKQFDAAGILPITGGAFLIVGLATGPGRDLDDFVRGADGTFQMPGFEAHLVPRLRELVSRLRGMGLDSRIYGNLGYPAGGDLNLKRAAAAAGVAAWGKNAMLLHERFGPRLRLASIRLDGASLELTGPGLRAFAENRQCRECNACIEACPAGVLEPYYMRNRRDCRANLAWYPEPGPIACCDLCWKVCPAGKAAGADTG